MTKRNGTLIFKKFITREYIEEHAPNNYWFMFGDNMAQTGYGGQAREMRGAPNTIGVPTKWRPSNEPSAFFSERSFWDVRPRIIEAFDLAHEKLKENNTLVLPEDGFGTGLADLANRAPTIYHYIGDKVDRLFLSAEHVFHEK